MATVDHPGGAALTSEPTRPAPSLPGARLSVLCIQPVAERGGSDQALLRLVEQLGAAGWDVHVALPAVSPMAGELEATGASLHLVPMRRISTSHDRRAWAAYALNWPLSVWRLWRLARHARVDVVHSNSLHSWYGWAVAALVHRPHIWHAREIVTQSRAALRVERALARWGARRVIAVSEAVAAQLDPANVVVVHEDVSPAQFHPGRAGRARARYDLADDELVVGYVGRIDTWKGVDVLIEAAPLLERLQPGAKVVVAGGAVAGKQDYAVSLAARACGHRVGWLGPLSGPEAGDLIADLDCLAYPSTSPEPWGLTLVEALACGVPVVATKAGGPVEVLAGVAHGGRLVTPKSPEALASAIAEVLPSATSTALRRRRPVLRAGAPPPYPELFAAVAARLD